VMIGVGLCAILLLRPRGILGEVKTVSRHIGRLPGRAGGQQPVSEP
jgi:branched-chain amino acid transport system permease protein